MWLPYRSATTAPSIHSYRVFHWALLFAAPLLSTSRPPSREAIYEWRITGDEAHDLVVEGGATMTPAQGGVGIPTVCRRREESGNVNGLWRQLDGETAVPRD